MSALRLLAILYALICVYTWQRAYLEVSHHGGLAPAQPSPIVFGDTAVQHSFRARSSSLGRLYLFPLSTPGPACGDVRVHLWVRESTSQDPVYRWSGALRHAAVDGALAVPLVAKIQRGRHYTLGLHLPEADERCGLRLAVSAVENGGVAGPGGGTRVNHTMLPAYPQPPWMLLGAAAFLALVAIRRGDVTAVGCVAFGLAGVLSQRCWEASLWTFWGEYWPDGYVQMAAVIESWLQGERTAGETLRFFQLQRNACTFVVPALLGVLQRLGCDPLVAYVSLNAVFSAGTIVVLVRCTRRCWPGNEEAALLVPLLVGLNVATIRCFNRPLTDATGGFFAAAMVTALLSAHTGRVSPWTLLRTTTIGVGAVWTRLALLPLALLPMLFAGVSALSGERERAPVLRHALASILIASVVCAGWTSLGLWQSFAVARSYSAEPVFRNEFSMGGLVATGLLATQIAVPLAFWQLRRVLRDPRLWLPFLGAAALVALLAAGQIVPWLRYWTPIVTIIPVALGPLLATWGGRSARWIVAFGAAANVSMSVRYPDL